jgi:hypothetical protein
MKLAFNVGYFCLTIALFAVEICIALFVKDSFVRPFVGDALVVVLIYCFCRTFFDVDPRKAALGVLLLACVIEILQYFDYAARLGLADNRLAATILGRTFEWKDFMAYFAGFLSILLAERIFRNGR